MRGWKITFVVILAIPFVRLSTEPLQAQPGQISIPFVENGPRMPSPYVMRDWKKVGVDYHNYVFNSALTGVNLPLIGFSNDKSTFGFNGYVYGSRPGSGEAMACIAPVVGGLLCGIDMKNLYGYNFVEACKKWYNPSLGIYVDAPGAGGATDAGVYGYWPVLLSTTLMSRFLDDPVFKNQLQTTVDKFNEACVAMGCPGNPNFANTGYDFQAHTVGARNEPMNVCGNAATIAWVEYVGWVVFGQQKYLDAAKCAIQWQIAHPGRYEVVHLPGPLCVARLNAEAGQTMDVSGAMKFFFGDFTRDDCPWKVTSNTTQGGITCDGLDGAWWDGANRDFYAFSMGSLHGPAWLVPVVRYDPRFARAIGKYALNAANSCRLLQGYQLDWSHQDHKDWKDLYDPGYLLFYEGLKSYSPGSEIYRPYATGDPILAGWYTGGPHGAVPEAQYYQQKTEWFSKSSANLSLYMGNSVGFLGGIFCLTNVDSIIQWDCLKTDFFHQPAFPTYLYYNPCYSTKTVTIDVGPGQHDLYDAVPSTFVKQNVALTAQFDIPPDQARVIVVTPANGRQSVKNGHLLIDDTVVNYSTSSVGSINNSVKSIPNYLTIRVFDSYIAFSIPSSWSVGNCPVAVTLYNLKGNMLLRKVINQKSEGAYILNLRSAGKRGFWRTAGSVYLCKIEAGTYATAVKLYGLF